MAQSKLTMKYFGLPLFFCRLRALPLRNHSYIGPLYLGGRFSKQPFGLHLPSSSVRAELDHKRSGLSERPFSGRRHLQLLSVGGSGRHEWTQKNPSSVSDLRFLDYDSFRCHSKQFCWPGCMPLFKWFFSRSTGKHYVFVLSRVSWSQNQGQNSLLFGRVFHVRMVDSSSNSVCGAPYETGCGG